jgi:hypothetical protein
MHQRELAHTRLHLISRNRDQYIGIPAKSQLVRNNINTVLGFRDLLGKRCVLPTSVWRLALACDTQLTHDVA